MSLNAHLGYANTSELLKTIVRLKPATVLAYLDNKSHAWILQEIEKVNPQGKLVVRMFHRDDNRFHHPGSDGGYVMSPQTFLREHSWMQNGNRRWIQAMNEPNGYDSYVPRLNMWFSELMNLSTYPLAVFNFGVGHPQDQGTQWTSAFDQSIKTLNRFRNRDIASFHEYGPGVVFRIGRYRQFMKRCETLGISPIPFVITEHGADSEFSGDPLNGWKSRRWSQQRYFDELMYWYNSYYKREVVNGLCKGLHIFSYGNSGGWENFDIEGSETLINLIATQGPKDVITLNPAPAYPPLLSSDSQLWKRYKLSLPNGPTNVRSVPSTQSNVPLMTLRSGQMIDAADTNPELSWVQVKLMDGTRGWMSRANIRLEPMDTFSAMITARGLSMTDFDKLTSDLKEFLEKQNFDVEVKPL
jgi:hypothetical protein